MHVFCHLLTTAWLLWCPFHKQHAGGVVDQPLQSRLQLLQCNIPYTQIHEGKYGISTYVHLSSDICLRDKITYTHCQFSLLSIAKLALVLCAMRASLNYRMLKYWRV